MATHISVEDAQARLADVIENLVPGEELVITRDGVPLATLIRSKRTSWPCPPGTAKDTSHWMAPDFDAPWRTSRSTCN
jgi:antitoxin (DNA-binding transcriptional repressor) of toxin-antitoxin stability system